jgi:histidinol dehydrogenase
VPTPDGVINDMVLAAADVAGVDEIYRIGGAQAVAALAYGTETIAPVDKIVGPGNIYVAMAKRQVFGKVGIDMIAGPSEILVLCDGTTDPDWVAMDLFSQAEHDVLAQSILVCPDEDYISRVEQSIDRLLPEMPRQEIIRQSLNDRGAAILARDIYTNTVKGCDLLAEYCPIGLLVLPGFHFLAHRIGADTRLCLLQGLERFIRNRISACIYLFTCNL